jgi:hypothetical protein
MRTRSRHVDRELKVRGGIISLRANEESAHRAYSAESRDVRFQSAVGHPPGAQR